MLFSSKSEFQTPERCCTSLRVLCCVQLRLSTGAQGSAGHSSLPQRAMFSHSPRHEGPQHPFHSHSHSVKHPVPLNKSTLEAAESWLKLQLKQCSLTCQNMLSIVFPRKPSLPSDDTSLGPRMVINSSKSTWPSPARRGKHQRLKDQREGWVGRDF